MHRPLSLWALAFAIALGGCHLQPAPGTALREASVVEGPVLVQRGDHYYLRYRRAAQGLALTLPLVAREEKGTGYYYFAIAVSHREYGNLIERPLAYDGFEALARAGRIRWLDPDGTSRPIPQRREASP